MACLGADQQGRHLHAAMCVSADGSSWPWLIVPDETGEAGCSRACCAPHEQIGRLPADLRDQLELRCGAPTRKGTPCRQWVRHAGDRCPDHREDR
jgi:hypothetical protein